MTPEISDVLSGNARWALVCADNREILPRLPDKSVAHTICDPPYSAGLYARTKSNKGHGRRPNGMPVSVGTRQGSPSSIAIGSLAIGSIDEILEPCAADFLRLTTRWLLIFHDVEIGHRWRAAVGDCYVRAGAWVKANPMPQVSADRPAAGFEPCIIAHAKPRGRMRWNGGGRAAVWVHANAQGEERPAHPCPKPLDLMLDLVADFTDLDEVVLDPFAGSATTGVACLRLGRRFIGIEKDAGFAQVATERLEAEGQGLTLRAARAGQMPLFGVVP